MRVRFHTRFKEHHGSMYILVPKPTWERMMRDFPDALKEGMIGYNLAVEVEL